MKSHHFTLLAIVAAAIVSCSPYPDGSSPSIAGMFKKKAPEQASQSASGEVPAPQTEVDSSVPVGRPTPDGKKDMVISPYKPYNVIDVKGYKSGDIVGDPSTAQVDAAGKLQTSTSKHFRIP